MSTICIVFSTNLEDFMERKDVIYWRLIGWRNILYLWVEGVVVQSLSCVQLFATT